jgi:hypothetical protein
MNNAFTGKSRLDSPRPGAIYTPWCRVAFGARSNGQEATAKKQWAMTADQRQWLDLSP